MKKFIAIAFLFIHASAPPVYELTRDDPFNHTGVTGLQISFFGVKLGDKVEKAKKNIPGFVSDVKSQKRLMFKDAFVDYNDRGEIIRIAIGKSFASSIKGKTRKLFDADILDNAEKRYSIVQPEKEKIKVRETVLDKITIEQYIFTYPGRHFALYGSKKGDKMKFDYFVLEK